MRVFNGSFTLETAIVFPVILLGIYISINAGIVLYDEVCTLAESLKEKETLNVIDCMYRMESIKDLFGVWYED